MLMCVHTMGVSVGVNVYLRIPMRAYELLKIISELGVELQRCPR